MEKQIWITAEWSKYNKEFNYSIRGYAPSEGSGCVLVEERTIQFETPADRELQRRLVEAKRAALQKLRGDHYVEEKEAEEEIQELLCLEAPISAGGEDDIPF